MLFRLLRNTTKASSSSSRRTAAAMAARSFASASSPSKLSNIITNNSSSSKCSCCANGVHNANSSTNSNNNNNNSVKKMLLHNDATVAVKSQAPDHPELNIPYEQLLANNEQWRARKWEEEKDNPYFQMLADAQHPEYLYIGCADSRVVPNEIFGLGVGELFVHRNVANVVVPSDMSMLSILQFAVEVVQVKHILVMGHTSCGGLRAAIENKNLGLIENWLQHIRHVHRLHNEELKDLRGLELENELIKRNVLESCMQLAKMATVRKNGPKIHGLFYQVENGEVQDLHFDRDEYARKWWHIYKYDEEE